MWIVPPGCCRSSPEALTSTSRRLSVAGHVSDHTPYATPIGTHRNPVQVPMQTNITTTTPTTGPTIINQRPADRCCTIPPRPPNAEAVRILRATAPARPGKAPRGCCR